MYKCTTHVLCTNQPAKLSFYTMMLMMPRMWLLQGHSDINVTDAAGTNHVLGKYIAATLISKLKARMSVIQLLEIHLLCYCSVKKIVIFGICCFQCCLFICIQYYSNNFSIRFCIRLIKPYSAHLRNGEVVVLLVIKCVDNEKDGECNFNTWQRRNRTKSQYSSKLQRCWGPEDP